MHVSFFSCGYEDGTTVPHVTHPHVSFQPSCITTGGTSTAAVALRNATSARFDWILLQVDVGRAGWQVE